MWSGPILLFTELNKYYNYFKHVSFKQFVIAVWIKDLDDRALVTPQFWQYVYFICIPQCGLVREVS